MKLTMRVLLLAILLNYGLPAVAAISATNEPFPGILIYSETRTNPPTRLFVATIDLKNPHLHLRVVRGGADPDGAGKWKTTLLEPTRIAAREKFDLVVNGDFFVAQGVNDGEGAQSHFQAGQWALTVGPGMTDGKTWSTSAQKRPCLVVRKDHSVTIESLTQPAADDWEVVGGNVFLVRHGVMVPHSNRAKHPRTVVGINGAGDRLTILVVDGRKPGVAVGMTYDELAEEMIRLGCSDALNLDGGGSSIMALRDTATGTFKTLNVPTDGHERAVADVLGISIDQP